MSLLETISKPQDRPVIVTILGEAGLGKTSLAATFPSPIFIRAEDGLQSIPAEQRPDAFPELSKVDDLWDQLAALINEEHQYKTLVIDSTTALERMFIQHVIDSDPKKPKSINQANGGFGSGLSAVATLHGRVRKAAGILNKKGMHIVFVAHADTETIELPDSDPYMRYSLRLGKKSIAPYTDDVDLVGLVKLQMFLKGGDGERKKAISNGDRVISCSANASSVTKNRYGLTDDLPFTLGENPFTNVIPTLSK
ncbi:Sak4-like ssDNA annealing protein [Vibrio phage pYD21-A]|uniref:Sak4-like ssDNA annealing protein n=1 Tax=Vibrio phage pYD21-A TaxID=754049 RepID=UPI0002C0AF98|nr:Sak4-like ssDNA annealing protein [Vibrio phage pYD21-A]AGH16093.1 hypothetical protein VPKG_00056 [Vibrio phage pYD21-A]